MRDEYLRNDNYYVFYLWIIVLNCVEYYGAFYIFLCYFVLAWNPD